MKIHTIQLNIEDFESGTAGMDAREKGAYISLLICLYKVSSHELPDDDKRLARMACLNMREWKKVREILEPKFETYNGVWKHKRVLQEADRYQKLSHKNTGNRLKGKQKPSPVVDQPHDQTATNTNNKELVTKKDKEKIYKKELVSLDDLSVNHIEDWLTKKRVAGKFLTIDEHELLETFKDYCLAKNPKYKDYVAAYRNSFKWENAPRKGNGHAKPDRANEIGREVLRKLGHGESRAIDDDGFTKLSHIQ